MLGPLILVAFVYEFIGMAIAWIVKQFVWVPHRFRYGILVAGGFSNIGDIRELPESLFPPKLLRSTYPCSDCYSPFHNGLFTFQWHVRSEFVRGVPRGLHFGVHGRSTRFYP